MKKEHQRTKRVLVYFPSSKRTVAMESMIIALNKKGIEMYFLTTCEPGDLHKQLAKHGIKCDSNHLNYGRLINFIRQVIYLVRFCKREDIDIVFSHLQDANIIAVIAQFFSKTRFIIFRHHFNYQAIIDKDVKRNSNEIIGEKLVNTLSKVLVVPSQGVRSSIIKNEKVNNKKLKIIPYIYDFSKYAAPNPSEVEMIISKFPAKLRLIMVSRFIKPKRHELVFQMVEELIRNGYDDIVLIALDDGPEKSSLEEYIKINNLTGKIVLPGFKKNVIDYMSASDLLIHPSLYDASNSVVKEMGLLSKPIIAVNGIGDFNSYIQNGYNGFLISSENSYEELKSIIINAYNDISSLNNLGFNLRNTVLKKFSVSDKSLQPYFSLLH